MEKFFFRDKSFSVPLSVYCPSDDSYLLAENVKGARGLCIDMGCGSGIQTLNLLFNGAQKVICVDINEKALETTLLNCKEAGFGEKCEVCKSDLFENVKEKADVIIIDEAHHFRNKGLKGLEGDVKSRYWSMYDICEGKELFFLTATPVNNRLTDLQHMIELFSRDKPDHFKNAPLGIHSLPGHFRKMEKALEKIVESQGGNTESSFLTNQAEAEKVLWSDELFRALVVQRSRAYVKKSQEQHGGNKAIFPKREPPEVVPYQLKKTYGSLLVMVEKAFEKEKPLFSLAIYYPLAYYTGPDEEKQKRAFEENRQKQVVSLIRIQFLKRFESSVRAFEFSCELLLVKLLAWATKHSNAEAEKRR